MVEGNIIKMEVDYSNQVVETIEKAKSRAAAKNITEAIDMIMVLEKQTRLDSDAVSTGRLLEGMIEIVGEAKEWQQLNDILVLMSKKRSQLKQAVTKMVQKAVNYVAVTPNKETKLALIDTLRSVTDGKIYVELERARLTKELAAIKEKDGDINSACSILLELQVETYGSMEKREKVEFILEQIRLCLLKNDFVRVQILSEKINTKFFETENTDELKLKYYDQMIQIDYHKNNYLSVCKHFWEVFNTKSIQEDEVKHSDALKNMIANLILSPYDNEQSDLLHRRSGVRELEKFAKYQELVKLFINNELINWSDFCQGYESMLCTEVAAFKDNKSRWEELKSRVIEHNIRIIAMYYTRIGIPRMAHLLSLSEESTEDYLSKLVVNKTIVAKIDRLRFTVNFTEKKAPMDVLNDWSHNVDKLMGLINQTTHLINKERVVHAV